MLVGGVDTISSRQQWSGIEPTTLLHVDLNSTDSLLEQLNPSDSIKLKLLNVSMNSLSAKYDCLNSLTNGIKLFMRAQWNSSSTCGSSLQGSRKAEIIRWWSTTLNESVLWTRKSYFHCFSVNWLAIGELFNVDLSIQTIYWDEKKGWGRLFQLKNFPISQFLVKEPDLSTGP